ncbi:hypothetical protein [Microbacterium rhizomatis]|uniref:Uncharacterized protein n=1 Tax=Microbacterium rhizomatis TaxID=1631477 RepID=A0A5J5IXJ5_9MICO|nr:hypothetical protein [Microbacterium rhizomatis]KAA9106382.1 hypothetical protein F6B43_14595 [Microbacterium rhizomatis]
MTTSDDAARVARRTRQLLVSLATVALACAAVIAVSAVLAPRPVEELIWGTVAPVLTVLLIAAIGIGVWRFGQNES